MSNIGSTLLLTPMPATLNKALVFLLSKRSGNLAMLITIRMSISETIPHYRETWKYPSSGTWSSDGWFLGLQIIGICGMALNWLTRGISPES